MKTLKIAIFLLLPLTFFLSGCGLKKNPVAPEEDGMTYFGCDPTSE